MASKKSGGILGAIKNVASAVKNAVSGSSSKGNSTGGNRGSSTSSGYFDQNKDYAAAIRNESDPAKKQQLMNERQNKLNWMNANGTNKNGYTNDIYSGGTSGTGVPTSAPPTPKGQYQSQTAALNNTDKAPLAAGQATTAAAQTETSPTAQTSFGAADAATQAAMQAYITRQYAHQKAESGEGTYNGDGSMSLSDQGLLKSYQKSYNDAKARGDRTGMDAAHRAAENLRDNYRYYPTAKSNGYGLGENNIGWVRDLVVRGDELGNKMIDEYNRGTVTTTKYDKDGNFVNRYTSGNIADHDARVAKEMQRVNEKLTGKENNTFALRLPNAEDAKLSNAELLAKYGGGITEGNNGIGLYTAQTGRAATNGGTGYASGGTAAAGGTTTGNALTNTAGGTLTAAGNALTGGTQTGTGGGSAYDQYGYFDPNKDYAAAIKNAGSTQEMVQLQKERQNKLAWLNANGQNQKGWTNQIYSNYNNLFGEQQSLPEYTGMTKDELFDGYNDMAASLEKQRQALLSATLAQNEAEQEKANSQYDELARQAYILRRQNENALPQQLAALGISGGGSESANLQLAANYENSLNSNEAARQQALKDYALQALQARTQADSDINGYYADAKQQAMNAWQNESANRNSWNQWAANYNQQLREYGDSMNSQTYQEILANKQYQDSLKEQQINLALQMGDYKKLAALGYDTSYLKRMQDAELEQMALEAALTRANIAKVNSSVTQGSGGGTSKSSGGSNKNSGGDTTSNVDDLPIGNEIGSDWIMVSGMGRVGDSEIDKMLKNGTLKKVASGGKAYYMKAR